MPAQTHSRVRNGFHILANSRGILTNLNGPPCNTAAQCEKAYCCGPAIQPLSSKPRGCRRGLCSFTHNRGRKRALALGGVGSRSAATKRAISRRVENRNKMDAAAKINEIISQGTGYASKMMNVDLRRNHGRHYSYAVFNNRRSCFITRCFYA